MKKSYSKPMAEVENFSVENTISTTINTVSAAPIGPKTGVKFTLGNLQGKYSGLNS